MDLDDTEFNGFPFAEMEIEKIIYDNVFKVMADFMTFLLKTYSLYGQRHIKYTGVWICLKLICNEVRKM